jgi:hypothetical protein
MVRLQIQLDAAQHRQVKRRAKRLGVSVAEVVRRCVTAQLGDEGTDDPDARAHRALAVAGRYADPKGAARVAREHDAALAKAFRR